MVIPSLPTTVVTESYGKNQPHPVEITMDDTVHMGLFVTTEDPGRTAEARFSDVNTTGDISPSGPFTESRDISLLTATTPAAESKKGSSEHSNETP